MSAGSPMQNAGRIFARPLRPIPRLLRSRVPDERRDGVAPAEPRAVVAAVAEVVDAARGHRPAAVARGRGQRPRLTGRARGTGPRGCAGCAGSGRAAGRGRRRRRGSRRTASRRRGRSGSPGHRRRSGPARTRSPRSPSLAARRSRPSSTSTVRTPVSVGELGQRRRPEEPARVDRDEVVADLLDLAEEVAGEDDRDPELVAGPPDELEHLVAAGGVEPVRGFVEEEQPRVVDERLGELDPLAHARSSSRRSAGSAPRTARRGAARRRSARGPPCRAAPTAGRDGRRARSR